MTDAATHLALGDTAAGVLHDAAMLAAVPAGTILRFRDIYCVGPLGALGTPDGAASRARYWAELLPAAPPAVAEFDEEEARYRDFAARAARGPVYAWVGAHSSAQLWLQRLCATLPARPADFRVVDAADATRRTVSQFEPAELAELLVAARAPAADEIERLAHEWRRNAATASGVRRWVEGHISHHADDFYDGLLLAQCDEDWQPAEQAIGSAQWECDEFLGDVFFAWRLRSLARTGRLLWRGPADAPGDAEVRLAAPAAATQH